MLAILKDIELDVEELKCVMQAIGTGSSPALKSVARRGILQMRARLDTLLARLDDMSEPPVRYVEEPPSSESPREEVAEAAEEQKAPQILAESIRPAFDLRHAISLNDSFRFSRELFNGDGGRLDAFLLRLGTVSSLKEAVSLFEEEAAPAEDNQAAADFMELLRKYFT